MPPAAAHAQGPRACLQELLCQAQRFSPFKRKGGSESFRYPDSKQFEIDQANSRIKLPKLGWVRYRNSREILGQARNITLSCTANRWYISIQTEREVPSRFLRPPRPLASTWALPALPP